MELSERDRALLEGQNGPGARLAMSILVRMADVYQASRLMDIEGAHIDSSLYMGDATLQFAERLAGLGARVAVPSTLNVSGVDEYGWKEWAVPPDWAEKAHRQMQAYLEMGCIPTWTCTPYQTEFRPEFGQQIAWGESNAIAFANSIIGARTARYPDLLDICAAIAGRVPAASYHLDENRRGEILFRLVDIPTRIQGRDLFYPILGFILGRDSGERVPVVDGMSVEPTEDQLKAMCAAVASSGTVGLFHIVGVTPEAMQLQDAFQGGRPLEIRDITLQEINSARGELTTSEGEELDMVVLGSPHFSLEEFRKLAPLLRGRRKHEKVRFLVTSSRAMAALAEKAGILEPLRDFGGTITLDTCILTTPMLPPEIKTLMTNSAKYAYYAPGMLETRVVFGSLEDCVRSAIEGRVAMEEVGW